MAMKENSKAVLNYLKANAGKDLTADDIAADLGIAKNVVVGCFNALVRKDLGYRTEAQVENEDGTVATVKFLALTDAGMSLDPDQD